MGGVRDFAGFEGGSRLGIALALVGFTSVLAQIVLMRELLTASLGNELSLGLTLAVWLLWTAAGSSLFGRFFLRTDPLRLLALLQAALALALPCSIYIARASRAGWSAAPGEALGPLPILFTSAATLAVFCPLSGWLFAAGSRAWAEASQSGEVGGCSSMYLFEAAGSALGGVLASVVLLRALSPAQIACVIAMAGLISATWLSVRRGTLRLALFAGVITACALAFVFSGRFEIRTIASVWSGFRVIATRNSPYGNLAVIETDGNRSVLQNGIELFTVPDRASAEESAHFAMLEHPAPRNVLLIGGGLNGTLTEILKHRSVASLDYVEIDPALFAIARDYFPQQWAKLAADARVRIHEIDGRLFLRSSTGHFDVIIVSLPEPQTAQLNRLYTEEFFREAAARLAAGGVFALQMRGGEEYLSPQRTELLRCMQATLQRGFSDVIAIPGETIHFIGSNSPGVLTLDSQVLIARLHERGIQTSYVSEYFLPYRMALDRIADLRAQLRPMQPTRINRDFAPIAYYFDVALWSSQFSTRSRNAFRVASSIQFVRVLGAVIVLGLGLALMCARRSGAMRRTRAGAGYAVAATGLTLMAIEVLLLLGFQALYGYVFDELAVIVGAFMTGLALGTWLSMRLPGPTDMRTSLQRLLALQVAMLAAPLLVSWVLGASSGLGSTALRLVAHFAIPLIAMACGFAGGLQFSTATRAWFASPGHADSSGALYGLDLLGASAGAALISIYLLPVFGFLHTALLVAATNLGPVLLLAVACREARVTGATASSPRQTPAP